MPPSSPSYRCFLALTISSSLLFLSSQRQVLGCLPIVTVSLPQIISWRPGIPTYLGCRNLNQTFLVQRQRPSGFDYGGGGGGLKPQFNRGKPGGRKKWLISINSWLQVEPKQQSRIPTASAWSETLLSRAVKQGRWSVSRRLFTKYKLLLRQSGREKMKIMMPTESHSLPTPSRFSFVEGWTFECFDRQSHFKIDSDPCCHFIQKCFQKKTCFSRTVWSWWPYRGGMCQFHLFHN